MPFMPGLCGDARATLVGQRDTFLCTQATVPSSLGCSGKRSLATWGARGEPSVSLLPQATPPAVHPACATGAAKPSALLPAAAPGRQRLPTGMTRGHDRGPGWAQLQGCSRSHWGWGGFWSLGVSPRGGSRAAPASGSEGSSFWQGLPRGLSHIPEPPSAGTRRLLSRTVNTLCATFFSGTLGAGGGEREAGVRPETFLYTTNFLYIFNFAAT